MMKEYIDREAVIRLIETEGFNEKYDLGHPKDNDWFCEEVNRIPAADVVKVRHGHYICRKDEFGRLKMICSACGEETGMSYRAKKEHLHYCPNCGARMDGGVNDAAD